MKIQLENSRIDNLNVKAENEMTVENKGSEVGEIHIGGRIIELRGEFFNNINIEKATDIILDGSFRLIDNKISLDTEVTDIRMIYSAGTDVYMDILNNIKIDILKGMTKTKLYIKSKDIEILESKAGNEPFINIYLDGGQRVKVDESVNEINFNNEKNLEIEFFNTKNLPIIKNLNNGNVEKLIGSFENVKLIEESGVAINNIEFVYDVKFVSGVGIIENLENFSDLRDISLKIYEKKEYEIKESQI
ncbi:MAG: hypothetical protein ACRC28_07460 [Clostridium sp.]|uniref:hypothetical protein n=1 Tax=Clostridium sp. TaxID=1506 RepID=UPI003F2A8D11